MRKRTLLGRMAVVLLLAGLVAGWSVQALSLVTTGACMAAMGGDGTKLDVPASDSDDQHAEDMACEGVAVRCMNSFGCIVFVGLPQQSLTVDAPDPFGDGHALMSGRLIGLSHPPDLFPPILPA